MPINIPFGYIESKEELITSAPFFTFKCLGTYNNFNTVGSDPSQFTVDKVLLSLINDEIKKEVFSKEITVEKFSNTEYV